MQPKTTFSIHSSIEGLVTETGWKRIGLKHHHGLCTPLSALKSERSSGIGEFFDLLPLADFCEKIGFDIIQLLPLNDTGHETSPYNAESATALNPIYISLWALPYIEEFHDELHTFEKYNVYPKVAYDQVLSAKMGFLKNYFNKTYSRFKQDPAFQEFIHQNIWLKPFSLFKVLKEKTNYTQWREWDEKLLSLPTHYLDKLYKDYDDDMQFFILVQYLASSQLKVAKKYINSKNIFLKGDIPILISPESSDVWLKQSDFLLDFSAGSPPDYFNTEGQNWGFPLYRWERIEKDDFAWWKMRLIVASDYFDLFRIDHIIGFYRIWGIPLGKKPLFGSYFPTLDKAAILQGEEILKKLLSFTSMLPIGEDLGGMNIQKIRESMTTLGIPGTKILRWERNYDTDKSFIPYDQYPSLSLTSVSTHDSETLDEWWTGFKEDAMAFCAFKKWEYEPILSEEKKFEILYDSHHTSSFFHINLLHEYLSLFPDLVSPNMHDNRINIPGTISPFNWSYRMKPYLNELLAHDKLIEKMKHLATQNL